MRLLCDDSVQSENNSTLRTLSLQDNPRLGPRGTKAAGPWLTQLTALTTLNLSNIAMGHFGAQALGLHLPVTVQELDISNNHIGHDGLWKLAARLSLLQKLRILKVQHNAVLDDGCLELARRLPDLPRLQVLDLSHNGVGDTGVTQLAQCLAGSVVQVLNLAGNRVADAGATALAIQLRNTDLTVLNLADNAGVSDAGASALAQGLLPADHHGDESSSEEDDSDDKDGEQDVTLQLQQQEHLKTTSCLEHLDLSGCTIGDEGAGTFVEHLDEIPALQTLILTNNPAVSEARLRILEMLLKHRTSSLQSPRNNSTKSLSATMAVSTPIMSPAPPGLEGSEHGMRSLASTEHGGQADDENDDNFHSEVVYDAAILEGRELLQAFSLDSDGGGEVVDVPADYVSYLTDHYAKVLRYGTFGPLYKAADKSLATAGNYDCSHQELVVQRVTMSRAVGAMESLRETVWNELLMLRAPTLLPVLARMRSAESYSLVYDVTGGTTLYEILKDTGKRQQLTWKHRTHIVRSMAQALNFLHSGSGSTERKPLFHGDVHLPRCMYRPTLRRFSWQTRV